MREHAASGFDDVGKVAFGLSRVLSPEAQDDPFVREALVSIVGAIYAAAHIGVKSE